MSVGDEATSRHNNLPSRPVLYARAFAWWLVFFISTIVMTIPVLISQLISYERGIATVHIWLKIHMTALRLICRIDWKISGIEYLDTNPSIVMSKHQSTFETMMLPMIVPNPVFVAKRELALVPCFGWCLALADTVLIKRGAGRSAIKQLKALSMERFARNRNLVIFPEGTRRAPGDPAEYKIGGAVVAADTGVPVVPIAHNAGEFWPRHSFIKWPGTIDVRIGPPIATEGKAASEILQETVDWIENQQAEISLPGRYPY